MSGNKSSKGSLDRLTLPQKRMDPVGVSRVVPASGNPLPRWQSVPLDSKFPVAPAPKGEITFITTKMCEPAYKSKYQDDFDLSDPYNQAVKTKYNALYDPHLKGWFSNPSLKKKLMEKNLITPDGRVSCSVRDFNDYRYFLRRDAANSAKTKTVYNSKIQMARERREIELQRTKMRAELFGVEVKYKARRTQEKRRQELEERRKKLNDKAAEEKARQERKIEEDTNRLLDKAKRQRQFEHQHIQQALMKEKKSRQASTKMLIQYEQKAQANLDRIDYIREQRYYELDQKKKAQWKKRREHQEQVMEETRKKQERVDALKRTYLRRYQEQTAKKRAKEEISGMNKRDEKEKKRKENADAFAKRMAFALQENSPGNLQQPPKEDVQRTCSLWVLDEILHRLGLTEECRNMRRYSNLVSERQAVDSALTTLVSKMARTTALGPDQDMLSQIIHLLVRRLKEAHPSQKARDGITSDADKDPTSFVPDGFMVDVDDSEETERAVKLTMCATMDLDRNWEESIKLGVDAPLEKVLEPGEDAEEGHEEELDDLFKNSMRMSEADTIYMEGELRNYLAQLEAETMTPEDHVSILQDCLRVINHDPVTVFRPGDPKERNPDGSHALAFTPEQVVNPPESSTQEGTRQELDQSVTIEEGTVEESDATKQNPDGAKDVPESAEDTNQSNKATKQKNRDDKASKQGTTVTNEPGASPPIPNDQAPAEEEGDHSTESSYSSEHPETSAPASPKGPASPRADSSQRVYFPSEQNTIAAEVDESTVSHHTDSREEEAFQSAMQEKSLVDATRIFLSKMQQRAKLEGVVLAPSRLLRFVAVNTSNFWARTFQDDDHELGDWLEDRQAARTINGLLSAIKRFRLPPGVLQRLALCMTSSAMAEIRPPRSHLTDGVVKAVLTQFLQELQDDNVKISVVERVLEEVLQEYREAMEQDHFCKVRLFVVDVLAKAEDRKLTGHMNNHIFRDAILGMDELPEEDKDALFAGNWKIMIHQTKVLLQLNLLSADEEAKVKAVVSQCGQELLAIDGLDVSDDPSEVIERLFPRMEQQDNFETDVVNMLTANVVKVLLHHRDLPRIQSMTLFPGALNTSQSAAVNCWASSTMLGPGALGECVTILLLDKLSRDMGQENLSDVTKAGMAAVLRRHMVTARQLRTSELEGEAHWTELDTWTKEMRTRSRGMQESVKVLGVLLKPCLVSLLGGSMGDPQDGTHPRANDCLVKFITQVFVSFIRGLMQSLGRGGLCANDSPEIQSLFAWRTMAELSQEARSVLNDILVDRTDGSKPLRNRIRKTDSVMLEGLLQSAQGDDGDVEADSVDGFLDTLLTEMENPGYNPLPDIYPRRRRRSHVGEDNARRAEPTPRAVRSNLRRHILGAISLMTHGLTSEGAMKAMGAKMADIVAATAFVLDGLVAWFHEQLWKLRHALQNKRLQSDGMLEFLLKHNSQEVRPPRLTTEVAVKLVTAQALSLERLQNSVRTVAKMVESLSRMARTEDNTTRQPVNILGYVHPLTLSQLSHSVLLELCRVMTVIATGQDEGQVQPPQKKEVSFKEQTELMAAFVVVRNAINEHRNQTEREVSEDDQCWSPKNVVGTGQVSVIGVPVEVLDRVYARLGGLLESFKDMTREDDQCENPCSGISYSDQANTLINEVMNNVAYRVDIGQFPFARVKDMYHDEIQKRREAQKQKISANVSENRRMDMSNSNLKNPLASLEQDISGLLLTHFVEVLTQTLAIVEQRARAAYLHKAPCDALLTAQSFLGHVKRKVQADLTGNTLIVTTDTSASESFLKQHKCRPSNSETSQSCATVTSQLIKPPRVMSKEATPKITPISTYVRTTIDSELRSLGDTVEERVQFVQVLHDACSALDMPLVSPSLKASQSLLTNDISLLLLQMVKFELKSIAQKLIKPKSSKCRKLHVTTENRPQITQSRIEENKPTFTNHMQNKIISPYAADVMDRGRKIETILKRKSALRLPRTFNGPRRPLRSEYRKSFTVTGVTVSKSVASDGGSSESSNSGNDEITTAGPASRDINLNNRTRSNNTRSSFRNRGKRTDKLTPDHPSESAKSSDRVEVNPSSPLGKTVSKRIKRASESENQTNIEKMGFFFDRSTSHVLRPYLKGPSRIVKRSVPSKPMSNTAPSVTRADDSVTATDSQALSHDGDLNEKRCNEAQGSGIHPDLRSPLLDLLESEMPSEVGILRESLKHLVEADWLDLDLVAALGSVDNLREKLVVEGQRCRGQCAKALLQWVDETPAVSHRVTRALTSVLRRLESSALESVPCEGGKGETEQKNTEHHEMLTRCVEEMCERSEESRPVPAILYSVAETVVGALQRDLEGHVSDKPVSSTDFTPSMEGLDNARTNDTAVKVDVKRRMEENEGDTDEDLNEKKEEDEMNEKKEEGEMKERKEEGEMNKKKGEGEIN